MTFDTFKWIQAAKKKDEEAFDKLFETYSQEIYRYCYSIARNHEDAEDRVSQTYINAWNNIHALRGVTPASFRKWLFTIAANVSLGVKRQESKYPQAASLDADDGSLLEVQTAEHSTMEQDVFANSYAQQLLDAIQSKLREKGSDEDVPADKQDFDVFICRYYKQMDYNEIANAYGRDNAYWRRRCNTTIEAAIRSALLERAFHNAPGLSAWKNPDYQLFWLRIVKGQTFEEAARPLKQIAQMEKLQLRWHKTIRPVVEQSGFTEAARIRAGQKWDKAAHFLFSSRILEGMEYCNMAHARIDELQPTAQAGTPSIPGNEQVSLTPAADGEEAALREMWGNQIKPVVEATLIEFSKQ